MFETPLTVVGAVITDITQKTMPSGDRMATCRLVARERKFNRDSQEWTDGDHLYLQVICWRRLAENVGASVFKGDEIIVTGRLYLNEYEVNGEPRAMMQLDARAIGPNRSWRPPMIGRPGHPRPFRERPG